MTTAQRIDQYLKRYKSPLAGYGSTFVKAARNNGFSPYLLVAIAGAESSFGKVQSGRNNAWGWGPGIDFGSYNEAIQAISRGLGRNYIGQGLRSVPQIGSKWAPQGAANDPTNLNSHWVTNVNKFMSELGGSSQDLSASPPRPGAAAPSTAAPAPNPDLSEFALQGLGQIGKGYDPLQSLSDLTDAVASQSMAPTPGVSGPERPQRGSGGPGITFSGQKLTHDTDGLGGFPAVDLFAKPGTAFKAPESGKVIRLSGRGGTSGQVYGYSVYFQGDSGKTYFITHLGPNRPRVGTRVRQGQRLGTVSRWSGGSPHAHVGVKG